MVFDKPSGHLAVPGRGADKQDCLTVQGPDDPRPGVYRKHIKGAGEAIWLEVEEYGFDKLKKDGCGRVLCRRDGVVGGD